MGLIQSFVPALSDQKNQPSPTVRASTATSHAPASSARAAAISPATAAYAAADIHPKVCAVATVIHPEAAGISATLCVSIPEAVCSALLYTPPSTYASACASQQSFLAVSGRAADGADGNKVEVEGGGGLAFKL